MSILLTEAAVRRLKKTSQRRIIRDEGSQSLFLIIQPSGFKSWAMRFRRGGNGSSKMVLGPVDFSGRRPTTEPQVGEPLSLPRARQLAARLNSDRASGIDVIGRHKAVKHRRRVAIVEAAANSFPSVVRDFISEHAKPRVRTWRTVARVLGLDKELELRPDGLASRWADRDVRSVTADDLHAVIEEARRIGIPGIPVLRSKATELRAWKIFTSLSSLFSWAHRRRRVETNPMVHLHAPAPPSSRDRVLSDDEICKFWSATDALKLTHGDVLKLLLLTACRVNEIARLEWSEVSDDGVLNIPGARTKNGLPLLVPLSPLARDIIDRQPRTGPYVFAMNSVAPICLGSRVKNNLDAAMGNLPAWRFHDLRRTAATSMAAISVQPHIIEAVLNHVSGFRRGVGGVYNRHSYFPEKKTALEQWESHLLTLVGGNQ